MLPASFTSDFADTYRLAAHSRLFLENRKMFIKLNYETNEFYAGKQSLCKHMSHQQMSDSQPPPRRQRITILPELDTPTKEEIAALENEWIMNKIAVKHYICRIPTCKKKVPKGKLTQHMVKHHVRASQMHFACHAVDCEAMFLHSKDFQKHLDNHPDALWPCFQCDKVFHRANHYKEHQLYAHVRGLFACKYTGCTETGKTRREVGMHIVAAHLPRLFTCKYSYCGKQFEKCLNMLEHERKRHTPKRRFSWRTLFGWLLPRL